MIEQWKPCPGFEGLYAVSDLGRVKRIATANGATAGAILSGSPNPRYLQVGLRKGGRTYFRSIHRLVAMAFVPNPQGLPEVHHVDENKLNNRADNLEWISIAKHRSLHPIDHDHSKRVMPHGEKHWATKVTDAEVIEIQEAYATGWATCQSLGERYGISKMQVSRIVKGTSRCITTET
jgi:hypothetical protein